MYEIIVEHPAERFIKKLDKDKQKIILDSIETLSKSPFKGKKLVGKLDGLRSLRVDNFRVIYKVEEINLIILVLRAGYRGSIYSQNI